MRRDVVWVLAFLLCVGVNLSCSQPAVSFQTDNRLSPQTVGDGSPSSNPTPLTQQTLRVQLLETGGFHGNEVNARSGQQWLGLYANEQGSQLILSKLKIEIVVDEIVDTGIPGQKTGKSVWADREEEPIFLVRNAPMLQSGKAITIYGVNPDEPRVLLDRQPLKLQLGDLVYELVLMGDEPSAQPNVLPLKNPRLILRQGPTEQVVYQLKQGDEDAGWQLRWAGDIDGDGKLDLYANLPEHYNVTRRKLFLSSQAKLGQLVREVAEFVTTGC